MSPHTAMPRYAEIAARFVRALEFCELQLGMWDYSIEVEVRARRRVRFVPRFQFGQTLEISAVDAPLEKS